MPRHTKRPLKERLWRFPRQPSEELGTDHIPLGEQHAFEPDPWVFRRPSGFPRPLDV